MEEKDLREEDGHGRLDSTETAKEVHNSLSRYLNLNVLGKKLQKQTGKHTNKQAGKATKACFSSCAVLFFYRFEECAITL